MTMRNIVSVLFLLSISQLQMVHCIICKGEQYIVKMPDNSTKCQPCYECHAGYGRYPICGSEVNYPLDSAGCRPCRAGTFSDKEDAAPCKACHQCAKHEKHTSPCTNTSDTVCSGTCEVGYYFTKKAPHICEKCSCCFKDGKDEPQQECKEHGLKEHCSFRHDRQCVSHPSASPSTTQPPENKTQQIILAVVGAIGFVVIALLIAVLWVKRWKQATGAERLDNVQLENISEPGNSTSGTGTVSANGRPQVVPIASIGNPIYSNSSLPGTPQLPNVNLGTTVPNDSHGNPGQSAASGGHGKFARQISRDSQNSQGNSTSGTGTVSTNGRPQVEHIASIENPSYSNSSLPGTPQLSTGNLGTSVPNDSHGNPGQSAASGGHGKFTRQISRDSQNSQGENGFSKRKRSLSATVMEMKDDVRRKMSLKKEDSLISDDEEDCNILEIERHPQSQTVKEGSRVEFTCKVRGENVLHEWLKDGTELTGKYEKGLVIDPVKMADFGQYTCRVRYKTDGSSKKSSPEELDVKPCEGRVIHLPQWNIIKIPGILTSDFCLAEYTHLSAISDFDTLAKVEGLLNRRDSVRCCQIIGQNYGMERYKIDNLEDSEHRGKDVMAFLRTAHPDLTAYDFCKQLKNVQRNDVVKLLEKHLASEVKSSKDEYQ